MTELKRCPFCGGNAVINESRSKDHTIQCEDCKIWVLLDDCPATEDAVIEAWNRRA